MKRAKLFITTLLSALLVCFCLIFAGCEKKIEGTYKFESITYTENNVTYEVKAGETFMGMITLSEDVMTIVLNEDGSVSFKSQLGNVSETQVGTWSPTEIENSISISFDGEPLTCYCDGTSISFEEDGMKFVLKK